MRISATAVWRTACKPSNRYGSSLLAYLNEVCGFRGGRPPNCHMASYYLFLMASKRSQRGFLHGRAGYFHNFTLSKSLGSKWISMDKKSVVDHMQLGESTGFKQYIATTAANARHLCSSSISMVGSCVLSRILLRPRGRRPFGFQRIVINHIQSPG